MRRQVSKRLRRYAEAKTRGQSPKQTKRYYRMLKNSYKLAKAKGVPCPV